MPPPAESPTRDFFISYNSADRLWAEWIAWQLEETGYSVVLQKGSFQPEQGFVHSMHDTIGKTRQTITLLSPDYLDDLYKETEWTAVFTIDPEKERGTLLPVQVRECREKLKGVLSLIVYIDLVGLDEHTARETLLAGVRRPRSKPTAPLKFPTDKASQPGFPARFPPIWNVPERNPFFTDREAIFTRLHDAFENMNIQALALSQAINGLGGIGKTQIAIEYAYRYRHEYQTVLWMPADSQTTLIKSCLEVAHRLNLPQKDAQDQSEVIVAVQNWFQDHVNWLLILDNADDLSIVRNFLPPVARGHVLITTRAQALGRVAQGNSIDTMTPEEGALLLLRRAGILRPGDMLESSDLAAQHDALSIARMMDGLPLALDQAGAYIEEADCTVTNYQRLYKIYRKKLLQRRGKLIFDHPESVATTWSLSFRRVQETNSAAAELLKLCAFLSPDGIPEEIITEGTTESGPELDSLANNPLEVDDAIAELRKYSLILRHPATKTLSIHRLVQTVLRDTMSEEEQRQWASRAIQAVNHVFPEVKFETWKQCQRYLPHAQECEKLIANWQMEFQEAAQLLDKTGVYLRERAHYVDAERILQHALATYEKTLGNNHPQIAHSLNNLAGLYFAQGNYQQSAPLAQRALTIQMHALGEHHSTTAGILANLANLCQIQGKYEEAESLLKRAFAIREQVLGPDHPDTAESLNDLADLYFDQKKYEEAESLLKRALAIREQVLGPDHPDTAESLNDLADLYHTQKRYEPATHLAQRAFAIREQVLGPDHPDTAESLNTLAAIYLAQNKDEQVESLLQRVLTTREQVLGSAHYVTAISLYNLAYLYQNQEIYEKAEPLYRRALSICERVLGNSNPITQNTLNRLVTLLDKTQRPGEAAALEKRIEGIHSNNIDKNSDR